MKHMFNNRRNQRPCKENKETLINRRKKEINQIINYFGFRLYWDINTCLIVSTSLS